MKKEAVFRTEPFGPVWLVGRETTVPQGGTAEAFVAACRRDGTNALLQALPGRISAPGDIFIWMGDYDPATKTFKEIPGVLAAPGSEVPPGFALRRLPRCTMGICTVTGPTRSLAKGAHNRLMKLMAPAGFAPDYSQGYSMEHYPYARFEVDGPSYEFSYYLPCKPV